MGFQITKTLQEYAQGAAVSAIAPVADFLAPTVPVPTETGLFKVYSDANRFKIPDTRRARGGRAVEVTFDASDATYNCKPNSLDAPVELAASSQETFDMEIRSTSDFAAALGGLAHEKTVIDKALAAAGAGTGKNWNSGADPINDLDNAIKTVLLKAGYGSLMQVGLLFGVSAFQIFKNNPTVRNSFPIGNAKKGGTSIVTIDDVGNLVMGPVKSQVSFMAFDDSPAGKSACQKFLLDDTLLIFARLQNPTRFDPSFMKTMRLNGKYMTPRTYQRDDGRAEVIAMDWSEDVQVANATAVIRLNISNT